MAKLKVKTQPKKLSVTDPSRLHILSDRAMFPRAISLESCNLSVTNGYYDDVLKTLKSFSNENDYNSRKPHPLHKEPSLEREFKLAKQKYESGHVFSLDVKQRHDTKRLFYCVDMNGICQVLTLCSDCSHKDG